MVCHVRFKLRNMYTNSTGVLQYLLGSFLVVSPRSMGTERVVSHHKKLKSIQRASLSNELYQRQTDYICECCWYCELRSQTSCCCFLAEKGYIESHRLMYINREISFEIFLELTRVYNFSIRPHHCSVHTDNIVCVVIYHVSEVLKICSQRLCSLRICNFMHKQQLINSFKKDFKMHQKCSI